jgi:hypothetical protein
MKDQDKVLLEFNEGNKEVFKIEEEVELKVLVKNIKQLTVKVFEFNTETYYMKNKAVFNTGINLGGLDAQDTT